MEKMEKIKHKKIIQALKTAAIHVAFIGVFCTVLCVFEGKPEDKLKVCTMMAIYSLFGYFIVFLFYNHLLNLAENTQEKFSSIVHGFLILFALFIYEMFIVHIGFG